MHAYLEKNSKGTEEVIDKTFNTDYFGAIRLYFYGSASVALTSNALLIESNVALNVFQRYSYWKKRGWVVDGVSLNVPLGQDVEEFAADLWVAQGEFMSVAQPGTHIGTLLEGVGAKDDNVRNFVGHWMSKGYSSGKAFCAVMP